MIWTRQSDTLLTAPNFTITKPGVIHPLQTHPYILNRLKPAKFWCHKTGDDAKHVALLIQGGKSK